MDQDIGVHVVLNETAVRGRGGRAWPQARRLLDEAAVRWTMRSTSAPGQAVALAAWARAAGARIVMVVGGDGTLNEVVNVLLGPGDGQMPATAPLPVGSGNDFAKPLGLPAGDVGAACRALASARERRVDVGRVNGRWFVNGVGAGLDGRVALEASRSRLLRGAPMYALALVRALAKHHSALVRLEIDGRPASSRVAMVNATNGPCHGGKFWICPQAVIDDGLLDLCVAQAMGPARLSRLALRATRATHIGQPGVSFQRLRHLLVTAAEPLVVHVDGEILGTHLTDLEVTVHPGRLRVLAPAWDR